MHVGEAGTCGEVLSAQRVLGEEVDVVGDNHEVANLEFGVHTSRGIAHEESLDTKFVHHANGERNLLHRVALVVVEASLHSHDVLAAQFTKDYFAGMALNRRYGEIGDFGI